MAKKQTQIERAIARLEADIAAKQAAIAVLRDEQTAIARRRPGANIHGLGPDTDGGDA